MDEDGNRRRDRTKPEGSRKQGRNGENKVSIPLLGEREGSV